MSATATDHLWHHFTRAVDDRIVVVRGEGCWIWDADGNRYLDALSALYCVNVGYGPWPEIADAAAKQLERLPFFTNWVGFATPPSVELAEKLTKLLPIDVGRIFFVGGGSEAIETALKIARQYHRLRGEPTRYKFVTRRSAYHGTTFGALSINGSAALRSQFEPLLAGCLRAPLPYRYRCPYCADEPRCSLRCADEIDEIVRNEGPETVAAVIVEPVQNSAGSITPPEGYFDRVREICDEHGILLVADEVICGFGRVGDWFGSTRYGIQPDVMTLAKGITFGGHPVSCAIGLANLAVIEREDLVARVQHHMGAFRALCEQLWAEHPMVGDVRGDGYFYSLELVKDKDTKETFAPAERDELIKGFLTPRARELGVYMRFDDRGETCAQFAPPL